MTSPNEDDDPILRYAVDPGEVSEAERSAIEASAENMRRVDELRAVILELGERGASERSRLEEEAQHGDAPGQAEGEAMLHDLLAERRRPAPRRWPVAAAAALMIASALGLGYNLWRSMNDAGVSPGDTILTTGDFRIIAPDARVERIERITWGGDAGPGGYFVIEIADAEAGDLAPVREFKRFDHEWVLTEEQQAELPRRVRLMITMFDSQGEFLGLVEREVEQTR